MIIIVWALKGSPAPPQQNSVFWFKSSDMSIKFACMKEFHKIWFCIDLIEIKPSVLHYKAQKSDLQLKQAMLLCQIM